MYRETELPNGVTYSEIVCDGMGVIIHKEWRVKNNRHRTDGPAIIQYSDMGTKTGEWWWVNGNLHRDDGPAQILCSGGKILREAWWQYGNELTDEKIEELRASNQIKQELEKIIYV